MDSLEEIERYFFGQISQTNCIDESLREAVSEVRVAQSRPREHEDFRMLVEDKDFYDELATLGEGEVRFLEGLRKYEKIVESKNTRMRIPGKSFSFCLELMRQPYNEAETRRVQQSYVGNPNNIISKVLASCGPTVVGQPSQGRPVIVVPNEVLLGNINTENAEQFLTEGKFVPIDRTAQLKQRSVPFTMDILDAKINFQVTDDLTSLKNKSRMGQVVAIFIKGDPHQFKNIQQDWGVGQIAKLFKKVRCYYLTFADAPIHPEVRKWNVMILKVDRFARHKDLIVHQEFLEDFKSFLLSVE